MTDDKGGFAGELVQVYPFEWLKTPFPDWDGSMEWLAQAYTKFNGHDPRASIETMRFLSPDTRALERPNPKGYAPERMTSLSSFRTLAALGRASQDAINKLATSLQAGSDDDSDDEDSEEPVMTQKKKKKKEKTKVLTPPPSGGKRMRVEPARFEAEPASIKPKKTKIPGASATKPVRAQTGAVPEPFTPGKQRLTKALENSQIEIRRSKLKVAELQKQVTSMSSKMQASEATNQTQGVAFENHNLRLLISTMKVVATSITDDVPKMTAALEKVGAKFGVDLRD
jgi:hypothetical protein